MACSEPPEGCARWALRLRENKVAELDIPIVLVQDNLNTHTPASLNEAFPAPQVRRLIGRLEWHSTPKTW